MQSILGTKKKQTWKASEWLSTKLSPPENRTAEVEEPLPAGIQPCNDVTQPRRMLLILKSDGVFANHSSSGN
jgi:hypothetical protein